MGHLDPDLTLIAALSLPKLQSGNAAPSTEVALRIKKTFDVSKDMLLRRLAWHNVSQMRACAAEITVAACHSRHF